MAFLKVGVFWRPCSHSRDLVTILFIYVVVLFAFNKTVSRLKRLNQSDSSKDDGDIDDDDTGNRNDYLIDWSRDCLLV